MSDPSPAPDPAAAQPGAESDQLAAPLYLAWQITNECNLACLHCIEESGPGKAFPDDMPLEARMVTKAIESVDRHLQGQKAKPPQGLELFVHEDEQK